MTRLADQLDALDTAADDVDDARDDDASRPPRRLTVRVWVALLALVGVAAAAALVAVLVVRPTTPGDDSAEAGFARDMSQHHAQAVEMSLIVRDRTDDAPTRLLAYDIATTQQQQIGQMYAWLVTWGDSQARTGPPMAWMGHDMADMSASADGAVMPGMATDTELATLKTLSGRDAEVLFLQLMIAHHRGGVDMAQAVLARTDDQQVVTLANSMVTSQQSEIDLMESMLAERGATDAVPSN